MTDRPGSTAWRWLRLLIACAIAAACAVYAMHRLQVSTSMTHFVQSDDAAVSSSIPGRMARSEGARTVIFTVDAPSKTEALAAADRLVDALRDHPEVERTRTSVDDDAAEAFWSALYPHRLGFASENPEQDLPEQLTDAGLAAALARLQARLRLPTAPLAKQIAPGDPWLFFEQRIEALQQLRDSGVQVEDGRLLTADGRAAVVLLVTRHSPFATQHQRPLQAAIADAVAAIHSSTPSTTIERSDLARLAVSSEQAIRTDVQRISIASSVIVLVLLLGLYRSPRALVAASLPLAVGFAAAAAVSAAVFGSIHGITLAFGATLIGVAIDYPIHLLTHHAQRARGADPRDSLVRIAPALRLGAATTLVVFGSLAVVQLPGVREIGVFAIVGIGTALVTTFAVVPDLIPHRLEPTAALRSCRPRAQALLSGLARRRRWLAGALLGVLVVAGLGLPRMQWVDDASVLNRLEPTALAEDERVRARVSRHDLGRLVVATGDTLEQALQRNDEVAVRLAQARAEGRVRFSSLHAVLFSAELQQRNLDVFAQAPDLDARLEKALRLEGFRPEAFEPTFQALRDPPEPLRVQDLSDSSLDELVRPFVLDGDARPAVVTFVRDLAGPDALTPYLDDLEGVYDFDQRRFSAEVYGRHRSRVTKMVGWGLVAVTVLLLVWYRRPRAVAAALLPCVLAVVVTLSVLALLGEPLHLLHLVGLLLVLGLGADYGIFLTQRSASATDGGASLVSVLAAALTTLGAFCVLALSSTPALAALGLTVAVGVSASVLLAPTALVLLRPHSPRGEDTGS